jgi:integrase/recombinase XerD
MTGKVPVPPKIGNLPGLLRSLFLLGRIARSLSLGQDIEPMIVAAYFEQLTQTQAPQTVKQHLAAIRMLFDWMVIGQEMPINPANSVRGPRYSA